MSFISDFKDATIGFSGYPRLLRTEKSGFGYLALLLLIVLTISAVITTRIAQQQLELIAQTLAAGPDFALENGRLRWDGPQPYKIEDRGVLIIIDTTGRTGPEALAGRTVSSLLVTETQLYQIGLGGGVQQFDLSRIPGTITRDEFAAAVGRLHLFVPVAYVLIYGFQLAFKAFHALLLALLATWYVQRQKREIHFATAYKLGIYAMTMPIILQWIMPDFTTLSPLGFLLWWGLAILYTVRGAGAYLATEERGLTEAEEE